MAGGARLDERQEQAVAALLTEPTHEAAAAKAGVSPRTLRYWLAQPEFAAAYRAARQAVLEQTVARLLAATGKAVQALERNLTCGKPQAEIRAAVAVLGQAARGVEVLDLAGQLEDLQRQLEGVQRGAGDPLASGEPPAGGAPAAGPAGVTAAGPPPGGPDPGDDSSGDGAGPVADAPAPLFG
jgi:hypothetical protein